MIRLLLAQNLSLRAFALSMASVCQTRDNDALHRVIINTNKRIDTRHEISSQDEAAGE